ncbi:MAG: D-amino acid aminotransferase [Steroidobacteraceae bacterium]|nr:D-amino acid aminotransferase [Nevskiaceae bacterium]MCP5360505.1 D-amino acid aminotransferase [Nevskiaceae bacterium]MCP5472851.1 D-amino acid aminotransferase [Nevskiaceae bacterium]
MAEPLPICHLDGEFLALRAARISPLDRGFLFADGVYEVLPVYAGRPFRIGPHLDRLARSLAAIRLRDPHDREGWRTLLAELIRRNGGGDQYVYLQVSRGAEFGRNHAPLPELSPTVFAFCAPLPQLPAALLERGLACVTATDLRWSRCDIKSVALLPNVLLRQLACDAGADETILLREGFLTDASASTVHVVRDGVLHTPPDSQWILPGTTRSVVEELATQIGLDWQATPVSDAALRAADEIWLSAATREIAPVTRLDGQPVGAGIPGPLFRRIRSAFDAMKAELAAQPW